MAITTTITHPGTDFSPFDILTGVLAVTNGGGTAVTVTNVEAFFEDANGKFLAGPVFGYIPCGQSVGAGATVYIPLHVITFAPQADRAMPEDVIDWCVEVSK